MPFVSTKQRKFMHVAHPGIARRWEAEAVKSGTPAVARQGKVGKALVYDEVEKGWMDASARNARRASRTARRQERVAARGGPFIRRHVTGPAAEDINATLKTSLNDINAGAREGAHTINEATDRLGATFSRGSRQVGVGLGAGLGGGIAGGLMVGEAGRQGIRRISERNQRERRPPVRRRRPDRVIKADPDYPYLLSSIRREAGAGGTPERRANPVSPLQMMAASSIAAAGYERWRNEGLNRKQRQQAMYQIVMGQTMAQRGAGSRI